MRYKFIHNTIQKKKKKIAKYSIFFMKILNLNNNVAKFQGKYIYLKITFLNIYNYI